MQKPQITNFLVLQTTYESIQVGLFANNQCLEFIEDDKLNANAALINHLDSLSHCVPLTQIAFIAVNQGPAPFTSLRVILATANGISFSSRVPLVGIDGMHALIQEQNDPHWPVTVALFNAYHNDCYYALQQPNKPLETGCLSITTLIEILPCNQPIRFIGQGVQLFKDVLKKMGTKIIIPEPLPTYASVHYIARMALKKWHDTPEGTHQLLPLYLKETVYKPSTT